MTKTKSGDRRRYWQEIINRQQASGQNVVGFCSQEGLAPASFHAWKRRLRQLRGEPGQKAAQALLPVQVVDAIPTVAGKLEVEWPNGIVLRVQASRYRSQELLVLRKQERRQDSGDALYADAECPAELRGRVALPDGCAASDCRDRAWRTAALEALLPDRWLAAHPEHRLEQREEESRETQARRRKRAARRVAIGLDE
jgi:hypothetical protein